MTDTNNTNTKTTHTTLPKQYTIQDIFTGTDSQKSTLAKFTAKLLDNLDGSNNNRDQYTIQINDTKHDLRILSVSTGRSQGGDNDTRHLILEVLLNTTYHKIRYISSTTAQTNVVIDGTPMTINTNSHLDSIVYKNSGGSGGGGGASANTLLRSQIPGKVVSIDVKDDQSVKKDDTICVLESMKMQVQIKAHRDGTVKSIKIKNGDTIAKNDVIANIE